MNSPLHSPLPSADVAEDFQEALSGLRGNNRWEIENLTVIARENTENASPISRVIETHIKTVCTYSSASCERSQREPPAFVRHIELLGIKAYGTPSM